MRHNSNDQFFPGLKTMPMKKNIIRKLFAVMLMAFTFSLSECKKDNSTIPNVSVDLYVYLSIPSSINLNSQGGWIYVNGGVKGIIVYRRSNEEFAAYERACPYDPNESSALVEVDSSNILAVDRHCGSKFNLLDNTIINGPTTRSLKAYHADYDASGNTVHVYN